MTEKKYKQVCQCENCGNEAEMTITCSFIPEEDTAFRETASADAPDTAEGKVRGQSVCTRCGNEADIWIDDIENLQPV